LTSILLIACKSELKENNHDNSRIELLPEPDKQLRLEYEKNKEIFAMSNDSLWNHSIFTKGGCLTARQHVHEGNFGGEGCVMSNSKEWDIFFNRNKSEITKFLIDKISENLTKTYIHTCPFFNAMEGEVAIYSLQRIYNWYKLNWYEFDEFIEFQNRQSESSTENHQAWLQGILKNKKK
jgi:hypothetical protein